MTMFTTKKNKITNTMNKIRNFQALFIERFDSSISMVDHLKKFKTTIVGSILKGQKPYDVYKVLHA